MRYGIIMFLFLLVLLAVPGSLIQAAPPPTVVVDGQILELDANPLLREGRVLVPLRPIFEALGAVITWDEQARRVNALRGERLISLVMGEETAQVGGVSVPLDVPPQIIQARTMVPLRFVAESMGAEVNWDSYARRVSVNTAEGAVVLPPAPQRELELKGEMLNLTVNGRTVTARVVRLAPQMKLKPVVALGENRVGGVEELDRLAARYGAAVAINGTFFNPQDYAEKNKLPTEPYGTLIKNGKVIHAGTVGSVVGFNGMEEAGMELLRTKIEGATEGSYGWPNNWYAYGFNRTPAGPESSASFIFTPERGERVGFDYGMKIVVQNGQVVRIEHDVDVAIPRDGYVIVLTGRERDQLAGRFLPGKTVEYRVLFSDITGHEVSWPYTESVGAGPFILRNGIQLTDYGVQGFVDQKILEMRGRRSALGLTRDGGIVLAVVDNVEVKEMAAVMQQLGADTAMNLDGGASSGLWVQGSYMVQPGRKISNALLFVPE